jgi:peroxin-13
MTKNIISLNIMSTAPPKPWENASGTSQATPINTAPPEIPTRPNSIQSQQQYGGASYGTNYGTGAYGSGAYGTGYGTGYGATGSGYGSGMYGNRMGMGGMYGANSYGNYGAMAGGYGTMTGGYGSGMYGNRMGMGNVRLGPNGFPIEENISFAQQMEQSTQSTFQVLDQIVQAFGGFSQMLESTFFATHSSFMAMV